MPLQRLHTRVNSRNSSLLSPLDCDGDTASIRSDQESDSDDDERQLRARNSRELRAHDRLVLMEEEEMDQLVTETRRRQERERRGSGLPLPNPLRLFSYDSRSRSRSPAGCAVESTDDLNSEKRKHRRTRRLAKKERLLAEARYGEDSELMHEMEAGRMKEGSSTGESSDREDSDEVDRRGLLHLADAKVRRSRNCRRWLFIHTMVAVAFSILILLAWKLSMGRKKFVDGQHFVSNGTTLFAPTTIIISLDGFRADFLNRGLTPRLNAFIREGTSPLYMLPSFPSVTFPNHYTLATGLYPESHGVVGNTFWDPGVQAEFKYTDPDKSLDPRWWMGEPFWVTAEKQGIRTAIHMWPGSEAHILGVEPSFLDRYNGNEKLPKKVERIFELLDKPGREDPRAGIADLRPQIIAAYVPNVDSDGHKYGPNSTEIRSTIKMADDMVDQIFKGLEERNLTHIVNVIVVSDHGMATTDISRLLQLEDIVDMDKIEHIDGWPLVGLRPKNPEDIQDLYDGLVEKTKNNPNLDVYLRDVNMPERYHFSKNDRIAPLWIIPKTGWAIVRSDEMNLQEAKAAGAVYHPRGLHGYDHEHPLMRAIFIARGPAFPHPPNSQLEPFQNIEVYNIICDSVGLLPMPNNGTLRLPLSPTGLHKTPDTGLDTPQDPVETVSHVSTSPSSAVKSSTLNLQTTSESTGSTTASSEISTSTPSSSSTTDLTASVDLPEATPTELPNEHDDGEDGNGGGDGEQGLWDWFKGKLDEWWHSITSPQKGRL